MSVSARENHVALGGLCGRSNWTNPRRMFEVVALDVPLAGASFGVWVETTTSGTRVHSVDAWHFFCAFGDYASGSLLELRGTGTFFFEEISWVSDATSACRLRIVCVFYPCSRNGLREASAVPTSLLLGRHVEVQRDTLFAEQRGGTQNVQGGAVSDGPSWSRSFFLKLYIVSCLRY